MRPAARLLALLLALAPLGGCVVAPAPGFYGSPGYVYAPAPRPYWRPWGWGPGWRRW